MTRLLRRALLVYLLAAAVFVLLGAVAEIAGTAA